LTKDDNFAKALEKITSEFSAVISNLFTVEESSTNTKLITTLRYLLRTIRILLNFYKKFLRQKGEGQKQQGSKKKKGQEQNEKVKKKRKKSGLIY